MSEEGYFNLPFTIDELDPSTALRFAQDARKNGLAVLVWGGYLVCFCFNFASAFSQLSRMLSFCCERCQSKKVSSRSALA